MFMLESCNFLDTLQVALVDVSHRIHETALSAIDEPWELGLSPGLHLNLLPTNQ